jgi:hypothetical protein
MPKRIQRQRTNGWRMPAGAVYVGRPTKWGNPWHIGDLGIPDATEAVRLFRAAVLGFWSNGDFCRTQAHPDSTVGRIIADAPRELAGRDLACWCPLDQPCHADVLLELANGPPRGEEAHSADREASRGEERSDRDLARGAECPPGHDRDGQE